MDVGEILAELKSIGAVDAPKEPVAEIVVTPIVEVRPEPLPVAPIHEIFKALETIRINLLLLVEGRAEVPPPAAVVEPVVSKSKIKASKKVTKAVPSVPAPAVVETPVATPVAVSPGMSRLPPPKTLEEARARVMAKIRGEDLPTGPGFADDEEDNLLFVGQDRAIPIDLRKAESVSTPEAMVGSP